MEQSVIMSSRKSFGLAAMTMAAAMAMATGARTGLTFDESSSLKRANTTRKQQRRAAAFFPSKPAIDTGLAWRAKTRRSRRDAAKIDRKRAIQLWGRRKGIAMTKESGLRAAEGRRSSQAIRTAIAAGRRIDINTARAA